MKTYILRRLLLMIPMLIGASLLVFLLIDASPGNYLTAIKAQRDVPAEYIKQQEQELGLNLPWYVQYFHWSGKIVRGDFGYSWSYKIPVLELIAQRAPATIALSLTSLAFAWIVAIPIGVLAAVYKDSVFDKISAFFAYAALSLPSFFLALLAVLFAARSGWFPTGGLTSIDHDYLSPLGQLLDYAQHLALPTVVLGLGGAAGLLRVMRTNMLDVIQSDYVMTARAKGVPENLIMFRHVLRNAINPLVTTLGFAFSGLLSGSVLVENVMNYPGLGQLIFQAFTRKDRDVVLAAVIIGAVMLIVGNLIADILLAWVDPRIRYEK
jgi:peptide/nickel transport system permease protein